MDKEHIKAEAMQFIKGCEDAQHKLTFCALIPQMPRYENTTYILQVAATWLENMAYSDVYDILIPIFFQTTTVEFRKRIFRIDLYDENGDLHCYFEDLILLNEINYNPTLTAARQLSYA